MVQKAVKCVKKVLLKLLFGLNAVSWQLVAYISGSPAAVIIVLISTASVSAVDNAYQLYSFLNAN